MADTGSHLTESSQPGALMRSVSNRFRFGRRLLSPWVQRFLQDDQQVASQPGTPFAGQRPLALTMSATGSMVRQVQRVTERSRVWQPNIGSLTPDMVARFSDDIAERYPGAETVEAAPPLEIEGAGKTELVFAGPEGLVSAEDESPETEIPPPPSVTMAELRRLLADRPASKSAPSGEGPPAVQRTTGPPSRPAPASPRPLEAKRPARRELPRVRPVSRVEELPSTHRRPSVRESRPEVQRSAATTEEPSAAPAPPAPEAAPEGTSPPEQVGRGRKPERRPIPDSVQRAEDSRQGHPQPPPATSSSGQPKRPVPVQRQAVRPQEERVEVAQQTTTGPAGDSPALPPRPAPSLQRHAAGKDDVPAQGRPERPKPAETEPASAQAPPALTEDGPAEQPAERPTPPETSQPTTPAEAPQAPTLPPEAPTLPPEVPTLPPEDLTLPPITAAEVPLQRRTESEPAKEAPPPTRPSQTRPEPPASAQAKQEIDASPRGDLPSTTLPPAPALPTEGPALPIQRQSEPPVTEQEQVDEPDTTGQEPPPAEMFKAETRRTAGDDFPATTEAPSAVDRPTEEAAIPDQDRPAGDEPFPIASEPVADEPLEALPEVQRREIPDRRNFATGAMGDVALPEVQRQEIPDRSQASEPELGRSIDVAPPQRPAEEAAVSSLPTSEIPDLPEEAARKPQPVEAIQLEEDVSPPVEPTPAASTTPAPPEPAQSSREVTQLSTRAQRQLERVQDDVGLVETIRTKAETGARLPLNEPFVGSRRMRAKQETGGEVVQRVGAKPPLVQFKPAQPRLKMPLAALPGLQAEPDSAQGDVLEAYAQIEKMEREAVLPLPPSPSPPASRVIQRQADETSAPEDETGTEPGAGAEEASDEASTEIGGQPDLDDLAKQVYPFIKRMLAVERERQSRQLNFRF